MIGSAGRLQADTMLMVVAVAWGSTYVVAKELVGIGSVLGMLSVRMGITALMLGAVIVVAGSRLSRADVVSGSTLGLALSAVFVFETFGIAHTSATNAGVIISTTMVVTPLVEAIVSRRPLSTQSVVLGGLALGGIVLLSSEGNFSAPQLGDGLVLVAALVRAIHVSLMRRRSEVDHRTKALNLTFVQISTCAAIFTVASMGMGKGPHHYVAAMSGESWLLMAYLTVGCTLVPFWVQMWAVRRTSASHVALLLGTEPIYAALIGVSLGGDRLGPIALIGMGVVLAVVVWNQVAVPLEITDSSESETTDSSESPRYQSGSDVVKDSVQGPALTRAPARAVL